MSREGEFLIYCIEIYKRAKRASGRQVYGLFDRYGVLGYIRDCYGALHVTGDNYIVQDIDRFIANQKAAAIPA